MNSHLATIAASFCFDSLLITPRENQQTALSTCLLECYLHELVDQLPQDDLAGDGVRHFDYRREIKVFDRRSDRAGKSGRWFFLLEVRKQLIELPHLPNCSPTEVAVPSVPQVPMRDLLETSCPVEARS